jgi:hypothetical protein
LRRGLSHADPNSNTGTHANSDAVAESDSNVITDADS